MTEDAGPRPRYGEAFWRTHHEAWKRSDLKQREYCEAQGLSLKAFGNGCAKFDSEPQRPARPVHRRRFSEVDRRYILADADASGASVSSAARRYGIARQVLRAISARCNMRLRLWEPKLPSTKPAGTQTFALGAWDVET